MIKFRDRTYSRLTSIQDIGKRQIRAILNGHSYTIEGDSLRGPWRITGPGIDYPPSYQSYADCLCLLDSGSIHP